MSDFSTLATLPADVAETFSLIDGVDSCFHVGFSRMTPEQSEHLVALARVFVGTPLEVGLKKAVEDVRSGVFLPEHMDHLATARAALMGACADALHSQAAQEVGSPLTATGAKSEFQPATGSAATWLTGVRDLLGKLVITGFSWLDDAQVATLEPTIERLQEEPALFRLATLMTGFYQELSRALPIQSEHIPVRRWSDLWNRAMLLTRGVPVTPVREVSGTFSPLGVELRQHANTISVLVHGVLDSNSSGTRIQVRTHISAWRCEVLAGPDVWRLLKSREGRKLPANDVLVEAIGAQNSVSIKGMKLDEQGNLIWSGEASLGGPVDVFALAVGTSISRLTAMDRHPVQVAIPVVVVGPAVEGEEGLSLAGIKVATSSDPAMLTGGGVLKTATRTLGMLKWNGTWYIQPLVVEAKSGKKLQITHNGQYGSTIKLKEDRFQMLEYKASKLLRKKS